MLFRFLVVLSLALFCIQLTLGCHHRGRRRGKRQTEVPAAEQKITDTEQLRDFLSECLRARVGEVWDWQSVVDVAVLDSFWYFVTDELNCGVAFGNDTVDCWKTRLVEYIQKTSQIYIDTVFCIDLYAVSVEGHSSRKKRHLESQETRINARCSSDYQPNSRRTRAFTECNSRSQLTSNRDPIDFPSISQFAAQEAVCGPEFPGCGPGGIESITSENDTEIPRWPYTLEALLKPNSPVRASVFECNNRIFPLDSGRTDRGPTCENWDPWSSCVGCQRSRSRTRRCQEGHTGQTRQQADCRPSPSCQRPPRPIRQPNPLCQSILFQTVFGQQTTTTRTAEVDVPQNGQSTIPAAPMSFLTNNTGLLFLISLVC